MVFPKAGVTQQWISSLFVLGNSIVCFCAAQVSRNVPACRSIYFTNLSLCTQHTTLCIRDRPSLIYTVASETVAMQSKYYIRQAIRTPPGRPVDPDTPSNNRHTSFWYASPPPIFSLWFRAISKHKLANSNLFTSDASGLLLASAPRHPQIEWAGRWIPANTMLVQNANWRFSLCRWCECNIYTTKCGTQNAMWIN